MLAVNFILNNRAVLVYFSPLWGYFWSAPIFFSCPIVFWSDPRPSRARLLIHVSSIHSFPNKATIPFCVSFPSYVFFKSFPFLPSLPREPQSAFITHMYGSYNTGPTQPFCLGVSCRTHVDKALVNVVHFLDVLSSVISQRRKDLSGEAYRSDGGEPEFLECLRDLI